MGVHLKEKPLSFRRKNKHPLTKLLNDLTKETPRLVERLSELMESENEKIALGACEKMGNLITEISKEIERDDTTRTLGDFKYNANGARELEEDDDTPQIDFNTLQDVTQ
jgi:hypothetical protein